jgi:hypothetical protein
VKFSQPVLTTCYQEPQLRWLDSIAILKARRAGVVFGNLPWGIDSIVQQLEANAEDEDSEQESFNWKSKVSTTYLYSPPY